MSYKVRTDFGQSQDIKGEIYIKGTFNISDLQLVFQAQSIQLQLSGNANKPI